ncbi:MAG: hypothetical protein R3343_04315 [Nitriliruptorales bacterium]|nr:hypothetical protein [Nitriliruptorales bacterium]
MGEKVLQRYRDVQEALQGLPGVAAAAITEGSGAGRGRLKIRLAAGHDPREVARAVSELLRQRFGINIRPSDIHPRPDIDLPAGAPTVSENGRAGRAAIRDLATSVEGLEVTAVTVLDLDGNQVTGRATGAATSQASLRAVARATLAAVDHLVPGRAKTDLEQVDVDGDDRVDVTVVYLTPDGEERLAGVALVDSGDVQHAVVRATLDAVNRRLGQALRGAQTSDQSSA